jgi:hypothetical protein
VKSQDGKNVFAIHIFGEGIDILKHIEENPKETRRLIGLEYEQLQQLIENAEQLNYEKQALLESKKIRIIAGAGGRKPKLSVKEQSYVRFLVSQSDKRRLK